MKKKTKIIICAALALAIVAGVAVYAATSYGTQSDPLITLSYLDETLTPRLLLEMQGELSDVAENLEEDIDARLSDLGGSYEVVTLSSGQRIVGEVGCEIMLRIGSATARGNSEPALVDTTAGTTLSSGTSLTANHLCMVTIVGGGITAGSNTVKVLVRGEYTIS